MIITDNIGIIADDLTGANECSLNFHLHGCSAEILLDYMNIDNISQDKQVWTISSESRNVDSNIAISKVKDAVKLLKNNFNIEYFYKKIDSTLRGNLACEALAMIEELDWDCAIILPALPSENRITVGGYHLSKGVPIEKTEIARDPHSPISESHIPTLLRQQLISDNDCVALLDLDTVLKGAGPILVELNKFISQGKKLIVCDATSNVDIEQIALAMMRSNYKILPCGSSGLANVLAEIWVGDLKYQRVLNAYCNVPRLVISGSSTNLTKMQIEKLSAAPTLSNKVFILPLSVNQVLSSDYESVVNSVLDNLFSDNVVVVHSSNLQTSEEEISSALIDAELTKDAFAGVISDFLANVCAKCAEKLNPVFVTIGGETTYKCCKALKCSNLLLVDEVTQAIPLCVDKNGHLIVSKSGNLGNNNTLTDIINYFNQYE